MDFGCLVRKHILVQGFVQGIGYRWFVKQKAQTLRMSGWVRNLSNGDVEIEAQGEPSQLEDFIRELRTGHSYAKVRDLKIRSIPVAQDSTHFEIQ